MPQTTIQENQTSFMSEQPVTKLIEALKAIDKSHDALQILSPVVALPFARIPYVGPIVGIGVGITYDRYVSENREKLKDLLINKEYQKQLDIFENEFVRSVNCLPQQRLIAFDILEGFRERWPDLPTEVLKRTYEIQFKLSSIILHNINNTLSEHGSSISEITQAMDKLEASRFKDAQAIDVLKNQSTTLTQQFRQLLDGQTATKNELIFLEQLQKEYGIQLNTTQQEGRLTQLAVGKLLAEFDSYQKNQASIHEQQTEFEQTKANFEGAYQAFGALQGIGQTFGNKDLCKIASIGQAGVSIALNTTIITGAMPGMAVPAGMALLGPYSAIAIAGLSIASAFISNDDNSLGEALEAISNQINDLHTEIRQCFSQTFANQKLILENQFKIYNQMQKGFNAILQNFKPVIAELYTISDKIDRLQRLTTSQFRQQTISLGLNPKLYHIGNKLKEEQTTYADIKDDMEEVERWILEETCSPFYNLNNVWKYYGLDWLKQMQHEVAGQLPSILGYVAAAVESIDNTSTGATHKDNPDQIVNFNFWHTLMSKYLEFTEQLIQKPGYELDETKLNNMLQLGKASYQFANNLYSNRLFYTSILQRRKNALNQLQDVFGWQSQQIDWISKDVNTLKELDENIKQVIKKLAEQPVLGEVKLGQSSFWTNVASAIHDHLKARFSEERALLLDTIAHLNLKLTEIYDHYNILFHSDLKSNFDINQLNELSENSEQGVAKIDALYQHLCNASFNSVLDLYVQTHPDFDKDQFLSTLFASDNEIRFLICLLKDFNGFDFKMNFFDELNDNIVKLKTYCYDDKRNSPMQEEYIAFENLLQQTILAPHQPRSPILDQMSAQLKDITVKYLKLNCLPKALTIQLNAESPTQSITTEIPLKVAFKKICKMIEGEDSLKEILDVHQNGIMNIVLDSNKRLKIDSKISRIQRKFEILDKAIKPLVSYEILYQTTHLVALIKKLNEACLLLKDLIAMYMPGDNAYGVSRLNNYINVLKDIANQLKIVNPSFVSFKEIFNQTFFNQVHERERVTEPVGMEVSGNSTTCCN